MFLPMTSWQDIGQGIIDLVGVTKTYNIAILIHGVSLSLRGSGRLDTRLDTPPISLRHHPVSRIAHVLCHCRLLPLRLQPDLYKPARWLDARLSRTRVEPGQTAKGVSTARLFLSILNRTCSTNKKTARRRSLLSLLFLGVRRKQITFVSSTQNNQAKGSVCRPLRALQMGLRFNCAAIISTFFPAVTIHRN
jgi:hypothetical protein